MRSARYSCRVLRKLEFFRHIFEKSSNVKFHENPSSWSRVVPCGQTDGEADLTKLTVLLAILRRCLKSEYFQIITEFETLLRCYLCLCVLYVTLWGQPFWAFRHPTKMILNEKNYSTLNRAIFCSWIRSVRGSCDIDCWTACLRPPCKCRKFGI